VIRRRGKFGFRASCFVMQTLRAVSPDQGLITARPGESAGKQLHDWTGQDFGESPLSKVLAKWEKWWAENSANYEPGRRYFLRPSGAMSGT